MNYKPAPILEVFEGSFNSVCFDKSTDERVGGNDKEDV